MKLPGWGCPLFQPPTWSSHKRRVYRVNVLLEHQWDAIKTILTLTKKFRKVNSIKRIEQTFSKINTKPAKAHGTRWIDFKFQAMEKESLRKLRSLHDSFRAACSYQFTNKKREKIKGFMKKWRDSGYLMHIAIFIDILSPMRWLSLSLQPDKHDPVKVTRRSNEFTWTMSKMRLIIENSLDEDNDDGQMKTNENIKDFEPDPVIDRWWTNKERRLKSHPHNYPTKKVSSFEFRRVCRFFNTCDVWFEKQWWWRVFFLIDIHVCNSIYLLLTFKFSIDYKRLNLKNKLSIFVRFPIQFVTTTSRQSFAST